MTENDEQFLIILNYSTDINGTTELRHCLFLSTNASSLGVLFQTKTISEFCNNKSYIHHSTLEINTPTDIF